MLGTSIVRYRLFAVAVAVKKTAVYALVGDGPHRRSSAADHGRAEEYFDLKEASALWLIVPLGGRRHRAALARSASNLDDRIQRMMFSKRQGLLRDAAAAQQADELDPELQRAGRHARPRARARHPGHPRRPDDPRPGHRRLPELPRGDHGGGELGGWTRSGPTAPSCSGCSPPTGCWSRKRSSSTRASRATSRPPRASWRRSRPPSSCRSRSRTSSTASCCWARSSRARSSTTRSWTCSCCWPPRPPSRWRTPASTRGWRTSNARLLEASRLKSQFLANMSHELRTPLNSIIGFSKVLLNRLDGDLTERQDTYVRSVHNSSRHLLELINSILDFSRIEAGKFEMRAGEDRPARHRRGVHRVLAAAGARQAREARARTCRWSCPRVAGRPDAGQAGAAEPALQRDQVHGQRPRAGAGPARGDAAPRLAWPTPASASRPDDLPAPVRAVPAPATTRSPSRPTAPGWASPSARSSSSCIAAASGRRAARARARPSTSPCRLGAGAAPGLKDHPCPLPILRRDGKKAKILYVEDNPENRMLVRAMLEAEGYTSSTPTTGWPASRPPCARSRP